MSLTGQDPAGRSPVLPSPADEAAILAVLARYSSCADRSPDATGWAGCFTADAVVRIFSRGRDTPLVVAGLDNIEHSFEASAPGYRQVHVVTNTIMAVDGPSAHLESCFVRLDFQPDAVRVGSFGRYHDVARRGTAGEWRLSQRDIHIMARVRG